MSLLTQILANVATIAVAQALATLWLKSRLEASIKHEYDRRLEVFRLDLSLGAEVAKQRVKVLGEAWAQIATYEAALFRQSRRLAELMLAELRLAGVPNIPDSLPEGTGPAIATLSNFGLQELGEDALNRLKDAVAPDHRNLRSEADGVVAFLAANRFWLGPDIDRELRTFLNDLTAAFADLTPSREDMRTFGQRLKELGARRPDAATIIAKLRPSVP
jgi:hypothetical protein